MVARAGSLGLPTRQSPRPKTASLKAFALRIAGGLPGYIPVRRSFCRAERTAVKVAAAHGFRAEFRIVNHDLRQPRCTLSDGAILHRDPGPVGGIAGCRREAGRRPKPAPTVSYFRDVRPIFQVHCQGCHQPAKAMGEFVMTSFERPAQGGRERAGRRSCRASRTKAISSRRSRPTDGKAEMPKDKEPLAEDQIKLIRQWIAEGRRTTRRCRCAA